jgi:hypothetical protein
VRIDRLEELGLAPGQRSMIVNIAGEICAVDVAGEITSAAVDGTTLAFTASLTHAVTLVPLGAAT